MKKYLTIQISALISAFAVCCGTMVYLAGSFTDFELTYAMDYPIIEEAMQVRQDVEHINRDVLKMPLTYVESGEPVEIIALSEFNNIEDFTIPTDVLSEMQMNNSYNNYSSSYVSQEPTIREYQPQTQVQTQAQAVVETASVTSSGSSSTSTFGSALLASIRDSETSVVETAPIVETTPVVVTASVAETTPVVAPVVETSSSVSVTTFGSTLLSAIRDAENVVATAVAEIVAPTVDVVTPVAVEEVTPVAEVVAIAPTTVPVATTATASIASTPVIMSNGMPEGYQSKFSYWYATNSDVRGWLRLAGTKLDYPIMQTTNDFYYLNRNEYKQSNVWGVPYMSTFCTTDSSTNTILFGHSRDATGEQLSALKNYRNVDFYKSNPTIEFDSVYADGNYKIMAYFIENTSEDHTFFRYHEFIDQTDPAYIDNFIAQAKLRSYINTDVDYNYTDKFLTISTCEDTNTSNYNRLVLVARKVREGESTYVDTSTATQNYGQKLP